MHLLCYHLSLDNFIIIFIMFLKIVKKLHVMSVLLGFHLFFCFVARL